MVMTTPAVALFVALGLWQLGEVLRLVSVRPQLRSGLAALVLLALAIQNGYFYLVEYPRNYYFMDRNGEVAMQAALQLDELGPNYGLYLFGEPHVFVDFPTTVFLAPYNIRKDLVESTLNELGIPAGEGALFVAIPENEQMLMQASQRFPGGDFSMVMRKTILGEVLYYSYTLQPATSDRP
jgi:hypothetical protein